LSGITGPSAGGFSFPYGVAVDPASGDLYVADYGNGVVDKFSSSGAFLSFFSPAGVGVQPPAGSFAPTGVAVDAAGNVFVADKANSVVDEFTSAGAYTGTQFGAGLISGPTGVAVDAAGDVFVASGFSELFEFGPTGTCLNSCAPLDTGGTFGATFDPASGHLYVLDTGYVAEYDSTGALVDQFAQKRLIDPFGLAVNDTTGDLYVGDVASTVVTIFGPLATIPDVAVTPASSVQPTTATLNGTVSPDGVALSVSGGCEFEYGTSTSYGTTVPCDQSAGQIGTGSNPVPVTAEVSGLQQNTTYYYRLDASNAQGANQSTGGSFTTPGQPGVDGESDTGLSQGAATLRAQLNPNGLDTTYHFEYGANPGYGTSVPVPDADIGSTPGDQPVSQGITGLQPSTTYHYRVVATNSAGTTDGSDQTFTTQPIANIRGEGAVNVTADRAQLESAVDVFGAQTSYHFEYRTTTGYATSVPVPDGALGTGADPQLATAAATGLAPGTTYHFRLVATNSFGTVTGPDATFTTQAAIPCPNAAFRTGYSAALPDCRAYEQVTPVDKNGTDAGTTSENPIPTDEVAVSPDGDAVNYLADGAYGSARVNCARDPYVARRTSSGWSTMPLAPPVTGGIVGGFNCSLLPYAFSPDGTQIVFGNGADLFAGSPLGNDLYLSSASGTVSDLVSVTQTVIGGSGNPTTPSIEFGNASADLSHVVFQTSAQLTPAAEPLTGRFENLYDAVGGQVHLVDVDNSGAQIGAYGAELGNSPHEPNVGTVAHAVSADGSKVFFEVPFDPALGGAQGLYMRENDATTTLISQPAPGVSSTPQDAAFEGASADGSKVFLWTSQQLTADDTNGDADLYEYDTGTGQLTRITAGAVADPGLEGVMTISDDGSHVYYVATGQLIAGKGVAGQPNLYVYDTNTRTLSFAATLSASDPMAPEEQGPNTGAFVANPSVPDEQRQVSAQATPDGKHLLFLSHAELTPYDSQGQLEAYEYSAASGSVECVSCNPSGLPPHADGIGPVPPGAASLLQPSGTGSGTPYSEAFLARSTLRNISDDGSRVVFQSPEALVPGALDHLGTYIAHLADTTYAENLYEWEWPGSGSCPAASTKGCLFLISGGSSTAGSWYGNMSPSGKDIYFYTRSSLAPSDTDGGLVDIYDARVDGGFPAAVTPTACQGQECHPGSVPSAFPTAASVTFSGPGNPISGAGPAVTTRVLTRVAHGAVFGVRVLVPSGGRIVITGSGIATARRSVRRAGTYELRVRLTAAATRRLARTHGLTLGLRVAFAPAGGGAEVAGVRLTVERAAGDRARRAVRRAADTTGRAGK
jgi:Tol biopolymer transport system component